MNLFLGDSITEAFPCETLLGEFPILNKGVSGDTTEDVVHRLAQDVLPFRVQKIFMLVGTNDLGFGFMPEETLGNFEMIISQLLQKWTSEDIIIQSILPARGHSNRPPDVIVRLNRQIFDLAGRFNIATMNLFPFFASQSGVLREDYSADGLHLLLPGYRTWSELIRPFLIPRRDGSE